jgi:thiamine biosynthesis lipoprotein
MTQLTQNIDTTTVVEGAIPDLQRFSHKAMATIYEIFIVNEDAGYAQQAAQEAFDELDRLEQELSRFIENSDISRINHLAANQPLRIGLDAFECLKLAARIFEATSGAFDVTVGPLMKCWLNPDKTLRSPLPAELELARQNVGMQLLELDESQHTVTLKSSPVHVDLGAIGKGYAVDVLARLLQAWDIETALIHGGRSSVFALGSPPGKRGWPLTISNPMNRQEILARLDLRNHAVSGSGLQKGQHIINPRTAQPLKGTRAAWAVAPDAATTDAISTAFMIMEPEEIENYCNRHPEVRAMIVLGNENTDEEKVLRYGAWAEDELLT